jgi:hypothetical protein
MIISVINHTDDQITDSELHTAIRAVNRQIARGLGAVLAWQKVFTVFRRIQTNLI